MGYHGTSLIIQPGRDWSESTYLSRCKHIRQWQHAGVLHPWPGGRRSPALGAPMPCTELQTPGAATISAGATGRGRRCLQRSTPWWHPWHGKAAGGLCCSSRAATRDTRRQACVPERRRAGEGPGRYGDSDESTGDEDDGDKLGLTSCLPSRRPLLRPCLA